jgi:hypothetical protein
MDQGSGAGISNPAAITASVKSVISTHSSKLETRAHPELSIRKPTDYRVADLFGRCFLRVCYWVDVFSSMTRRGEPLAFVPFPRQPATALPAVEAAQQLIQSDAASAAPGTSIASS